MFKYHYNSDGQPVACEIDGQHVDLSEDEKHRHPGLQIGKVRDVQTTINSTLEQVRDSYNGGSILVDIEATHGGYKNNNNYFYVADGMRQSVDTWTAQGGKPYIIGHDLRHGDPKGRVQDARFVSTGPNTGYHALDVKISDPEEVEKVLDQRALTVSVGSHAIDTVECSYCGHDMYNDGPTPNRVTLDEMPSKQWLRESAPGMYGMFGMTNEDFWHIDVNDDDEVTAICQHIRKAEAPLGGNDFEEIMWYMHQMSYDEVSRVNRPADINEATGEFAHIREVLEAADSIEDEELRLKTVLDKLSKVEHKSLDRARFSLVSENDLWVPSSMSEAAEYAAQTDYQAMFDKGQWISTVAQLDGHSIVDQVEHYVENGGRFVQIEDAADDADIFAMSPREFGTWLRGQDFTDEERRDLERVHAHHYFCQ
jgi:hypothetical protein